MIETSPDDAFPRRTVRVASPGDPATDMADGERINAPTIYDVARPPGVSIASVSRVLNGQRQPAPGDPGARAGRGRRARLRPGRGGAGAERPAQRGRRRGRPPAAAADRTTDIFEDEDESLQFPDLINRGIEVAAQRRGFDLLISSVERQRATTPRRIARAGPQERRPDPARPGARPRRSSAAGPAGAGRDPGGRATPATVNVRGDNEAGMRRAGPAPGPRPRLPDPGLPGRPRRTARTTSRGTGRRRRGRYRGRRARSDGPEWQGNYSAAGGAKVITACSPRDPAAAGHRLRQRPDRARRDVTRSRSTASTCPARSPSPVSTTCPWPATCIRS